MAHASEFEHSIPDTQPYVEKALSLYESAVRTRQGQIVFIAGDIGSGKSEIIKAMIQDFPKAKPSPYIISRRFSQGDIQGLSQQFKIDHIQTQDTIGNLLASFGAVAITTFAGPAALIGQLAQFSASVFSFIKTHEKESFKKPETPSLVKKLLYEATKEKPVIFLLDNLDEATPLFEWCDLLLELAPAISKLPVLFFVTLKGKEGLGEHEAEESLLEYVTRRLVNDRKLAECWYLKPMAQSEIAAWIGLNTAPGIVSKLHAMTGGNPSLIRETWREWKRQEAVIWNDNSNRWMFSPNSDSSNNLSRQLLNERIVKCLSVDKIDKEDAFYKEIIEEREETRELLACAALEGNHFTANALALAADWDEEELINFLDDKLVLSDENPDGILMEDGFVTIKDENGEPKSLCRYVFVSDSYWMALEKDGLTDKEKSKMSVALANALRETYESEERLVAHVLAELYKRIGQTESAQRFQTMASYAMAQESMREYALHFVNLNKDDWDEWLCRQTTTYLIKAAYVMMNAYPFHETLQICEEAYSLACRTKSLYEQAMALYYSSHLHSFVGDYASAQSVTLSAREIFKKLNDRWGEAASLQKLADIFWARGDYEEAEKYAKNSLEIKQQTGNRKGEAVSLQKLADVFYARGDYEEAEKYAKNSLEISRRIGDQQGEAISLQKLADIFYARGNYEEAEKYAKNSLEIKQQTGNRKGEAASLQILADIFCSKGDYEEAEKYAKGSLEIKQQIGDRKGEAVSLQKLADVFYVRGDYEEAETYAKGSLEIFQQIGDQQGEAVSLQSLADIFYVRGNYEEAEKYAKNSLEIKQQIGDRIGEALSLCKIGVFAVGRYKSIDSFRLVIIGYLILCDIGSNDYAERAKSSIETSISILGLTDVQVQELFEQAQTAFHKDGGRELITQILGRLPKHAPEQPDDDKNPTES